MTNFLPKGHRILAERLIEGRHIAQQININAQSKALALLAGRRRVRQRGRGVDFEEVRLYAAGDDVRTIDWRVTARSGEPPPSFFKKIVNNRLFCWSTSDPPCGLDPKTVLSLYSPLT